VRHAASPFEVMVDTDGIARIGTLSARRAYASDPPACYGIGWGCDLSPSTRGLFASIFYVAYLVVLAIVVGLLHLGGNRLASQSSGCPRGVLTIWAWAVIGTVVA
jgi:hypothetical protein